MFLKNKILTGDDLLLFPDFDKYLSELNLLENYEFVDKSIEDIYNIYYDFAKLTPNGFGIFNKRKFNRHIFYRVRYDINSETEDLSLIQTYSYPPPDKSRTNGRANLKGKSVFYCSNKPFCSIREAKPKIGSEGYLSIWKGNTNRKIKFGICLSSKLSKNNDWSKLATDIYRHNIKNLPKEAKDKFEHILELYNFVAKLYSKEKEPYSLTSMISNELLHADIWNDFIIYPSVETNEEYCNIAFHPNSVNENLKFEKVIRFRIENIEDKKISFRLGKVGYMEKTKMIWKEKTKEEIQLFNEN